MTYRKPEIHRVCAHCGETFACQHGHRKFCSDKCLFEADRKRALARYYSKRELREMETRQCLYCKEDFDTKNFHKTYCCLEHRRLAVRRKMATPEGRAKHRESGKRYRLNDKEAKKQRLQRKKEAAVLMEVPDKIPYAKLQRLPAEKIVRYWGRII